MNFEQQVCEFVCVFEGVTMLETRYLKITFNILYGITKRGKQSVQFDLYGKM